MVIPNTEVDVHRLLSESERMDGLTVGDLLEKMKAPKLDLSKDDSVMLAATLAIYASLILDQAGAQDQKFLTASMLLHKEAKRIDPSRYTKMGRAFMVSLDKMRDRAKSAFDGSEGGE